MQNVAYWFTRRANSFEGFVGNLFEIKTWVNPRNPTHLNPRLNG
jgi:hypothetical protein